MSLRRWILSAVVAVILLPATARADKKDIVFRDDPQFQLDPSEYRKLIVEMAITISPSVLAPADTLGIHGFDIGVEGNSAFIHSGELYWEKATRSGNPSAFMYMPTARIRKGLPFSFEVESTVSHIPFTEQNVISGGGRFALHEGFELVPDLTFGVNYANLLGNPYLRLGVFQWSMSLGYTWAIGQVKKIRTATISPYVAYSQLYVDSQIMAVRDSNGINRDVQGYANAAGLGNGGGLRLSKRKDPRPDKWVVGVQARSGPVSFLIDTELVDRGVPSVNLRVGTSF